MRKTNKRTEKNNPFLWFIFAIVIPVIVATTLTILVLAIAGVNVVDWAKKTGSNIPVLSSMIKTEEEKTIEQIEKRAETTITQKDEQIVQLNKTINDLEATVSDLEQNILKLENQITSEEKLVGDQQEMDEEDHEEVKQISAAFRNMKSKQAANIFQDLDDEIAIAILRQLSNDVRGKIFESMEPKRAAELTKLFIEAQ